jgi:hypothetical protein
VCNNSLHAKSRCCGSLVVRFGKRRRQCKTCKKTWRVRQKKRGRKCLRSSAALVLRTLQERRRLAAHRGFSTQVWSYRFRQQLRHFLTRPPTVPPPGPYVLLVDGMRLRFHHQPWTVYLLAFKPVGTSLAYFVDPFLLPGKESRARWEQVWSQVPAALRESVQGMVCDDLPGMVLWGQRKNWAVQLCQFHLLHHLYDYAAGKYGPPHIRQARKRVYGLVRRVLTEFDPSQITPWINELQTLSKSPHHSRWLRWLVSRFLKRLPLYRAWRTHPALHLPATTSAIESKIRCLRDVVRQARNLRTPQALQTWLTAALRIHPTIKCCPKPSTKLFC